MSKQQTNTRELVYKLLTKTEKESGYANIELASVLKAGELNQQDRAFFTRLFYGVIERNLTLNALIKHYSKVAFSKIDKNTRRILNIGLFQLFFMEKVPASAAVNESVKLASIYSSRSRAFVNAMLRKASADAANNIKLQDIFSNEKNNRIKYLSLIHSIPEWIIESYQKDYPDIYEELSAEVNAQAPLSLRINTLRNNAMQEISSCLEDKFVFSKYTNSSITLTENVPLSEITLIDSGAAFVQDCACTLAVKALNAVKGDIVYDMCACPGGKSFSAAIDMENTGRIVSFDIHQSKLSLISDGANRLGIDIIETVCADSSKKLSDIPFESADKIICDVPCSGLGVLSKKADMRYRDSQSIDDLPEIQYAILENSANYLKKGGVLVYSTCTLRYAENEGVIQKFLDNHNNFKTVDFSFNNDLSSKDGMLTLFPCIHNCDGFFIAKLIKN